MNYIHNQNNNYPVKIKKYQLITLLLAAYALFMTFYFGLDLLHEGQTVRFWVTLGAETIVIILAYFALRRRDYYRELKKKAEKDF